MAIVLAVGGVGWAFYYTRESDTVQGFSGPPRVAPMIEVARVARDDIEKVVHFSATVEPDEIVVVLPKISGQIEEFVVDLGDSVQQGDVIAIIDSAEIKQRELQAEASLELSKARLNRSNIALQSAQRELQRTRDARTGGLTTEQDLDAAQSTVATATADIGLARAEITRAEAALEEARLDLANAIIRAPISGFIDKRRLDTGALVSPTTPLCTVVRLDPAKIIVNIPETSMQLARTGTKANIEVGNVFTISMEGEITRVAPTVDLATRTLTVEITVPNKNDRLRPGMSADVSFIAGRATNALVVAEEALIRGKDYIAVHRVVDDIAHKVKVDLGVVANGRAEVRSGIEEGDLIVVKGNFLVEDEGPVRYPPLTGDASINEDS